LVFGLAKSRFLMREWCSEAGLPHCTSHGLRKTGAAIAAENGATAHELMSIVGWLTLKEAERYTRAAEQKRPSAAQCLCWNMSVPPASPVSVPPADLIEEFGFLAPR
jgi:hypothetical protein